MFHVLSFDQLLRRAKVLVPHDLFTLGVLPKYPRWASAASGVEP